ncbi:hypothetical protein V8B97DRAFT_1916612 [Scleroderma yunnanense]
MSGSFRGNHSHRLIPILLHHNIDMSAQRLKMVKFQSSKCCAAQIRQPNGIRGWQYHGIVLPLPRDRTSSTLIVGFSVALFSANTCTASFIWLLNSMSALCISSPYSGDHSLMRLTKGDHNCPHLERSALFFATWDASSGPNAVLLLAVKHGNLNCAWIATAISVGGIHLFLHSWRRSQKLLKMQQAYRSKETQGFADLHRALHAVDPNLPIRRDVARYQLLFMAATQIKKLADDRQELLRRLNYIPQQHTPPQDIYLNSADMAFPEDLFSDKTHITPKDPCDSDDATFVAWGTDPYIQEARPTYDYTGFGTHGAQSHWQGSGTMQYMGERG